MTTPSCSSSYRSLTVAATSLRSRRRCGSGELRRLRDVGAAAEGVAAVDGEALAGDPVGFGSAQVADAVGDILDGAKATQGHLLEVVGHDAVVAGQRGGEIGRHEAGSDRVHPHTG